MSITLLLGRVVFNEASRFNRRSLLSLIIGLITGFCMAELFILSMPERAEFLVPKKPEYLRNFLEANDNSVSNTNIKTQEINSIAEKLYKETRVLCWILTSPDNHEKRAIHVKETWGKRCNKLIFMSTVNDTNLGAIALNVTENYEDLWAKTKAAFTHVYENHIDEFDWFLKADDDTYVVVENLRYMLYPYSPETPIYFGCKFKPFVGQGYMSGGAGYVLSREAVRRFVVKAMHDPNLCRQDEHGAEDVEIGICLQNVNVTAGDSRDEFGRGRFFPFPPDHHLFPSTDKEYWYWKFIYYKTKEGLKFLSEYAIAFHYISPHDLHVMDYLIYYLRPYGILHMPERLPDRLSVDATLPPPLYTGDPYEIQLTTLSSSSSSSV